MMNRHQDDMRLYAVNPFTGKSRMLIMRVPKFVKEEVIENSIVGKKNIPAALSDRDGFMHLYLWI